MNQVVLTVSNWMDFSSISDLISDIKMGLKNMKLSRETYSSLSALSDKELKDIGVSRSEIPYIAKAVYRNAYSR